MDPQKTQAGQSTWQVVSKRSGLWAAFKQSDQRLGLRFFENDIEFFSFF
jgi:hypothetical protein